MITFDEQFKPNIEKLSMEKDVEGLIKALIYVEDMNIQEGAAEALGKIGDTRAIEPLIQLLKNESEYIRKFSAEVLGRIGDSRVVEPLIDILNDVYETVRYSVVLSLGEIRDAKAVEILIWTMKSDQDKDVRVAAVIALGKIGDAKAVMPLINLLESWRYWGVAEAAEALGEIGDTRAIYPLIWALKKKVDGELRGEEVQSKASRALGKIGGAVVEPLIEALKDENDYVRKNAAKALRNLDQKSIAPEEAMALIPIFMEELKDWRIQVREIAAELLGKIGGEKAVEPINTLLNDESWEVRKSAACALGQTKSTLAIESLTALLNDENWDVRWDAAIAIHKIDSIIFSGISKSEEILALIFPVLLEKLKGFYIGDRDTAAELLGEIGDERAIEPLMQVLKDKNKYVRETAAEALQKLGWKPPN